MSNYSKDFIQGQRDCMNGVPHQSDKSDAYNEGYSAQYEYEQFRDNLTTKQNERIAQQSRV